MGRRSGETWSRGSMGTRRNCWRRVGRWWSRVDLWRRWRLGRRMERPAGGLEGERSGVVS